MNSLILTIFLLISTQSGDLKSGIQSLSDCESLDNWRSSGSVQLVKDSFQGRHAIAASMPSGKVGAIAFDHGETGIDLSKVYALAFWWKSEGDGLRSFMIKVRNYPIAGGMEAVYPVWDPSMGKAPKGWTKALIILSEPRYDDWGEKPNRESRYISFRTSTSRGSNIRLFLDRLITLPPIFNWQVKNPVLKENTISISAQNMTAQKLNLSFGTQEQVVKRIDVPAEGKANLDIALDPFVKSFSRLRPFESIPFQMWAQVTELEETRMDRVVNVVKDGDLPKNPRLLFNTECIKELKKRVDSHEWAADYWKQVKANADRTLDEEVELPPRGGNWWHWYACPKHGAGLRTGKKIGEWQWEHICPVDNEVLLGDPSRPDRDYDGCVISGEHSSLSRSVLSLGIAFQMTGDKRYADKAREILIAYADRYLDYPLHTTRGEPKIGGGRVGPQTLDESTWIIPLCQGADLIWNELGDGDKKAIAQKLLQPAARDVILRHEIGVHNIQCWKNSAVGLVGFLLGDTELINEAIYNPVRGYWKQMREGVMPDGGWWEGAWGYHFYTLSALWGLTEAARNCGIDLYGEELKGMFDAPIKFAMPNLSLPAFNDSGEVGLKGRASIYELAFARYQDPDYVTVLSTSNRKNNFAFMFGVGDLPEKVVRKWESVNYPRSGYAILAKGEGEKATWLCMKYGPHGGGHGHPDKLNFVLYSQGDVIAPDPGTARYGVPIQRGWYRTTLAHNTLVVDEKSQKSAEGKCLAFGSEGDISTVDYTVAEAGDIYDGVRFTRSVALIDGKLILFIDQIRCEKERLLDVVYHNKGVWDDVPDGDNWTPPDKPGYEYLRDASVIEVKRGNQSIGVKDEDRSANITILANEPTQVITTTGVGRHAEDRIPMVIFRRRAKETAFIWYIALDDSETWVKLLDIQDSESKQIGNSVVAAIEIGMGDVKRVIITNPDGVPIILPNRTWKKLSEKIFIVE